MQEIGNLLKHYFLHIVCHKGTINVLWMWTRKTNFGGVSNIETKNEIACLQIVCFLLVCLSFVCLFVVRLVYHVCIAYIAFS